MVAYRVRKIETIEFSIKAESVEDVEDFLRYNDINAIVEKADEEGSFIQIEDDEERICPIRENSYCEINLNQ